MKTSVKIGFFFALIWIIINMVMFYAGISKEGFKVAVLINIFLLMSSIAAGLYLSKKEKDFEVGIFMEDFKTSMQSGIIYALTIACFVYLYHEKIDTSIKDELIANRIESIHASVPNSEVYAELQANDVTWKNKSYDDYIENQEDQARSMISSSSVFVAHLMGLTFFTFFFSFFITLIMRKVVLRG